MRAGNTTAVRPSRPTAWATPSRGCTSATPTSSPMAPRAPAPWRRRARWQQCRDRPTPLAARRLWVFGTDGLLSRVEWFDADRPAEALARFEELTVIGTRARP